MAERATTEQGGNDSHHQVDDEVESSYDDATAEGNKRLQRSVRVMVMTGLLGGIELSFGVLAYLTVLNETDSKLLGALAFSIGFAALYLAHSELFTEGFFYPIMAIFAGHGTMPELLKLWGITLLSNLVGGWVLMWLVVTAMPSLHELIAKEALHYVEAPFGLQSIALALLGGAAITLMTRMQTGSANDAATLAASLGGAFLLVGVGLFHSILDSIIIFGAIHSGAEGVSYLNWISWFWYIAIANVVGGLVLVTLPRVIRSSQLRTR